jgi:hypothetical protein
MNLPRLRVKVLLAIVLGINLAPGLPGCGGNPNEREFLNSAPPGEPSPFPNESVAQRKSRTKSEPKPVQKKGQKATDNAAADTSKK